MTPEPIEIHLPCEVLRVKVKVGPQERLSALEELFLRAIHGGVTHFQELARLFGIGHRPTLDLVFDLWHRGYLVLDLARGAVLMSAHVSRLISEDRLGELSSGEETDEVREVMLEKLTGAVLPVRGKRNPPNGRTIAPSEYFGIGTQDITTPDLLGALRRLVEKEERLGRTKKVLGAHLSLTELLTTSERRWLPLNVVCSEDEDAQGFSVQVIDNGELSPPVRRKVAERLALLVDDFAESPFAKYLRQTAYRGTPSPPDIDDVLARMEAKLKDLDGVDLSLLPQRHQQLCELADVVEDWCVDRRDAEADLQIVIGHDRHEDVVRSLIKDAKRQLVLVCPWVNYGALQPLVAPIRDALERGVQVFMLWGIKPDDELDQQVRNALVQLRSEFPARLFVSRRSSRTHAKVVVQDDRRALVTSLNFLSPSQAGTFELGVSVAARAGKRSTAVEGLLDWARCAYPEYTIAQSMYLTREDFLGARSLGEPGGVLSSRPVLPSKDIAPSSPLAPVAARLWGIAWSDHHAALRVASMPRSVAARLLRDGQHRDMLWAGLRNAKRRLLIMSDQLGPEVLDERFLRSLEERLQAGVRVTLVYRRLSQHAGIGGADPEAALAALESRYPDRLRRLANQETHAKVIVFDDIAVVASFNFLSFEGFYEEHRPGLRRRQRSEIGVVVSGANAADQVVAAVSSAIPGAVESWPSCSVAAAEAPVAVTSGWPPAEQQSLIGSLAVAGDDVARAALLREAAATASDSMMVLDRLAAARLPDTLQSVAVSAVLASRDLAPPSEVEARWLRWLMETAWNHGDLVEAAILAAAFPGLESPTVPRPPLALVAAARGTDALAASLADVSGRDDLRAAERTVIAMVALAAAALRGSSAAWDAVRTHRGALPPAWSRALEALERYWSQAYEPLPVETIRAEIGAVEHRHAEEAAWRDLDAALDRAAAEHFKFDSGTRTREYLFHPNGSLGRLRTIAAGRDANAVRAWINTETVQDLDAYLDNATIQATGRRDQLIEKGKRRAFLRLLDAIVSAARRIAALPIAAATREESRRNDLARGVARVIHAQWAELEREVDAIVEPHRRIVRAALDDLRIVSQWGEG
jgi:phosphatidylserine/phosphatidylglycerophosphate/cardiolipin synthase-like enzyme